MIFRGIVVSILLLMLSPLLLGQSVDWNEDFDVKSIAEHLFILEDMHDSYTLEDILSDSLQGEFKASDQVILNFGFTESSYWLHFSFDAPDNDRLLELAHTHLETVDFYVIDDNNTIDHLVGGYSIPVNEKIKKHHFQVFPLKEGRHDYYVKISNPVQPLPVRIHSVESHDIKTYKQRLVFGFYIGLIFFVIISNLFFFISLRNKLFLFYAGVVVIYLSYASMVMDGFIVYFLDNIDLIFWYKNIPTFGVPVQMIYALVFLEISKYTPKLYKYVWWLIYYFIGYAVIKFFIPVPALLAMNTIHALISFFGMFYLGYKAGKCGNKLGYYFALAYLIYFTLVLVEATYIQIGKPGYFGELSHVAWATIIEAFILSFLLSKRFEWERNESEKQRNEAQKQLLVKTLENEKIVKEQNLYLEKRVAERTEELNNSLDNLKQTQTQLIHAEKMASLGELTAGIAHEIKNPLNFVNNFSELSIELVDEVRDEISDLFEMLSITEDMKKPLDNSAEILNDIEANLKKIHEHGSRADSIVKSMLLHSRGGSGEMTDTDLNHLLSEYVNLSFHGMRAGKKPINVDIELDLDESVGKYALNREEFSRVIVNLCDNAFDAMRSKLKDQSYENDDYLPKLTARTKNDKNGIHIILEDNGPGIPEHIRDKILQPFFTTKQGTEGTGLGLSIAYDIVKAHGGSFDIYNRTDGSGAGCDIFLPFKK